MSVSLTKFANSMAKGHTIVATGAFVGSLIDGEHDGVAFRKRLSVAHPVEQRFDLEEVGRVEALGESSVEGGEQAGGLLIFAPCH